MNEMKRTVCVDNKTQPVVAVYVLIIDFIMHREHTHTHTLSWERRHRIDSERQCCNVQRSAPTRSDKTVNGSNKRQATLYQHAYINEREHTTVGIG